MKAKLEKQQTAEKKRREAFRTKVSEYVANIRMILLSTQYIIYKSSISYGQIKQLSGGHHREQPQYKYALTNNMKKNAHAQSISYLQSSQVSRVVCKM